MCQRSMSVLLVSLVAWLLAACGGGPGAQALSAEAIGAATRDAGSARLTVEWSMDIPEAGEARFLMEGVTTLSHDPDRVEAEMNGTVELPGASGQRAEGAVRMVDGRVFVKGFLAEAVGLPPSEGWREVPDEKRDAMMRLGGGTGDPTDPTAVLNSLEAATGLERVGSETVRGVETIRLTAETTLDELSRAQGLDMREQLETQQELTGQVPDDVEERMLNEMRELPVEFDVWVDDEDRLRRSRITTDMAPLFRAVAQEAGDAAPATAIDEVPMTVTFELYDYGTPVDLSVPSDAA